MHNNQIITEHPLLFNPSEWSKWINDELLEHARTSSISEAKRYAVFLYLMHKVIKIIHVFFSYQENAYMQTIAYRVFAQEVNKVLCFVSCCSRTSFSPSVQVLIIRLDFER